MTDIRTVTADFAVAPQLAPTDMAEAARRGFKLVINNRPDGEAPEQPSGAAIGAAARAANLDYVQIPVRGAPTPDQIGAMRDAVKSAKGPVLAFCRSGTRSITTWSIGRVQAGTPMQDVIDLGLQAGYDLSGVLE